MPINLDIKREYYFRSERVKGIDIHPTEPWVLTSLYDGTAHINNYQTQTLVRSFEVCAALAVRCARFIARKNWIITGSDDFQLRVFNYNTLEKVTTIEAHQDYIRAIAVHPDLPLVLSSSDDMSIKMWNWESNWTCVQVYESHSHFVMGLAFNPKDPNTFASACLDRTVKVWRIGNSTPSFTLEGHSKGVNCVDYYHGKEKPYIVSGADDRTIKIWDYQNKTCVHTLEGHNHNVSAVCFHPELSVLISASEDGTTRIWNANTFRLENTLNYGLERAWSIAYLKGSNIAVVGYDEGTVVIKLGKEEPVISLDLSGKVIWAKQHVIYSANLKTVNADTIKDGQVIPVTTKELSNCEIYPQYLAHSPNGRFVVVGGDEQFMIYTALAWRSHNFGSAIEFVWGLDATTYAIRESQSKVKIEKSGTPTYLVPKFTCDGIFGGSLLGVRSSQFICFYDWSTHKLVRKIEAQAKKVIWSENGCKVVIVCSDSFFVLDYQKELVQEYLSTAKSIPEDGIEDAFEVIGERNESVLTGSWAGDCFLYTSAAKRLSYFIGNQTYVVAHFTNPTYLLGYLSRESRAYLSDKDCNITSYRLSLSLLEYQAAVVRGELGVAENLLAVIPETDHDRVAEFLESQNMKAEALKLSTNPEKKFELALSLNNVQVAHEMAKILDNSGSWKLLGDSALNNHDLQLAEDAYYQGNDFESLLLLHKSAGDIGGMKKLAKLSDDAGNLTIAFTCYFLLRDVDACLDLLTTNNELADAARFAYTYKPSGVPEIVKKWKDSLKGNFPRIADSIADPERYPNLFPNFPESLEKEKEAFKRYKTAIPITEYDEWRENFDKLYLKN